MSYAACCWLTSRHVRRHTAAPDSHAVLARSAPAHCQMEPVRHDPPWRKASSRALQTGAAQEPPGCSDPDHVTYARGPFHSGCFSGSSTPLVMPVVGVQLASAVETLRQSPVPINPKGLLCNLLPPRLFCCRGEPLTGITACSVLAYRVTMTMHTSEPGFHESAARMSPDIFPYAANPTGAVTRSSTQLGTSAVGEVQAQDEHTVQVMICASTRDREPL
jgi:hypothetical protein